MLSLIIRTIDRRTLLSSIDISESAEGQAWLGMVGSRLTAQCRSGVGLLDCGSFSDLAPDTNQLLPLPLLLHGIDERQRLPPPDNQHCSTDRLVCSVVSSLESNKNQAGSSIISCILTRIDSSLKRHRVVLLISVTLGTGVYL